MQLFSDLMHQIVGLTKVISQRLCYPYGVSVFWSYVQQVTLRLHSLSQVGFKALWKLDQNSRCAPVRSAGRRLRITAAAILCPWCRNHTVPTWLIQQVTFKNVCFHLFILLRGVIKVCFSVYSHAPCIDPPPNQLCSFRTLFSRVLLTMASFHHFADELLGLCARKRAARAEDGLRTFLVGFHIERSENILVLTMLDADVAVRSGLVGGARSHASR